MNPLISVIVPVYNVEKYLPKCLDSILVQTYANLEIILVNDGSTDCSGEICDQYAAKDSRIKVMHKDNGGVSSARNAGLSAYSGECLMYVDPDDYISADAVQVMYERMIADGSDMVIGKHIDVYEDGSSNDAFCSWVKDVVFSREEAFLKMGDKNYITVASWGKLYKRTIFQEVLYPPLTCGEDLWVFPLIIDRCETVSIVDKTVYFYFQRTNSVMHWKTENKKLDELHANLHIAQFLWQRGIDTSAHKWYKISIDKALLLKKKREGIQLFKQYFSRAERKQLLKGESIKTHLKWFSLYVPFVFATVQSVKRVAKRG